MTVLVHRLLLIRHFSYKKKHFPKQVFNDKQMHYMKFNSITYNTKPRTNPHHSIPIPPRIQSNRAWARAGMEASCTTEPATTVTKNLVCHNTIQNEGWFSCLNYTTKRPTVPAFDLELHVAGVHRFSTRTFHWNRSESREVVDRLSTSSLVLLCVGRACFFIVFCCFCVKCV